MFCFLQTTKKKTQASWNVFNARWASTARTVLALLGLNWFCFTVLFDWSRKLAPPSQPIRCKLKPIAPWSLAFSRATGRLHAFTSSCHWLPLIISFTLIGRCDYFGFGFRHSIEKRSNIDGVYYLASCPKNWGVCWVGFAGIGACCSPEGWETIGHKKLIRTKLFKLT